MDRKETKNVVKKIMKIDVRFGVRLGFFWENMKCFIDICRSQIGNEFRKYFELINISNNVHLVHL